MTITRNARRGLRRLRSVAAVSAVALLAPLGLVTAVGVTATPAGAAPVTLHVSGDTQGRNTLVPGLLTWEGGDFSELQTLITTGDFGDATFVIDPPVASPATPGALDGIDVYFSSAVSGGYTAPEAQALLDFVNDGGVLIANTNSAGFDVTNFLGADPGLGDLLDVVDPPSHWSSEFGPINPCTGAPVATDCVNSDSAPVPSPAVGPSNVLNQGVTDIRTFHTFTYFDESTLPAEAVQLFEYSLACPTPATSECADPGDYDNDQTTALPVAAYVPFGSTQFGAGAIVMTTDSDTFSNDGLGHAGEGNNAFATNVFDWIGDHFAGPAAVDNAGFTPVTPTRIYDTRVGSCTTVGKVAKGVTRDVQVTGTLDCGRGAVTIPAGATAVALTVTATNQAGGGFLTVFPTGTVRPDTSNLNLPPVVRDIANSVAVTVGTTGKVSIYNSDPGNSTDLVVDIVGYWEENTGGFMNAVDPGRVFDTRNAFGTTATKLGPGETRTVQVTGAMAHLGGRVVVPTGATGAVLNVTATNATTGGFLTVYPTSAASAPDASSVNFPAGKNVPNLVFATLDSSGRVNVRNALGQTDVLVDVMGYVTTTGDEITPLIPDRLFDNRPTGTKIASNATVQVQVAGARPSIPSGVTSILANVTVDQPTAAGFLTVYPGPTVPDASNVNFDAGDTVPNLVLARVNGDGRILIRSDSPGTDNILVDVFAAFTPH
jgi:hypothetical protein